MWIDRHVEEGRKVSGNVISRQGIPNTLTSLPGITIETSFLLLNRHINILVRVI